ncbi:hypothetical protein Sango_1054400 [Sesamum angolense]|uniref:Retrotransposon gag protein n=1 Tax=Sesamum angolense TaxID=2727404 RepID=A0AAE1X1N2_9LAMI|nr:hypothetical protein Sango_1054400 [Sesamum angolense]
MGYQPPELRQFDGKGNSSQHIAHFIERCNNVDANGDILVKQFIRSLKGNTFNWYVNLEPESIDGWDKMEKKFLNRFYSTRRSLNCKDKLPDAFAIEICIQGMHWGLIYILQEIKLRNFEELATRAHDMELSIANHKPKSAVGHQNKELTKDEYFNELAASESMTIKATPVKFPPKERRKVRSKLTPLESNAEEFSKWTINKMPTNKSKKPPYSPIFPYVARSDEKANKARHKTTLHYLKESSNQVSSKAYHLLAKSRYGFFAPSQLGRLNPELAGKKIHRLTKVKHELRRQRFYVDQPCTSLGIALDEL